MNDDNPLDVDVCLPKVSDQSNPAKLPRKNQGLVKWKARLWEQSILIIRYLFESNAVVIVEKYINILRRGKR